MVKIAKLVYPSATGGATNASATVGSDTVTFKTTNNTITKTTGVTPGVTTYVLKDIEIIQTSAEGYQNSVKTDLQFDIYEKVTPGGSAGGVGNMSMMLDSPLVLSTANFKCLTMTGNAFMADYANVSGTVVTAAFEGDGHTYVTPGTNGVSMSSESRLNLKGTNNVIYGDLNLSGNASVAVYGNLTVYGDIKLSGDATLIVAEGGKIYQYTEKKLPGRTAVATQSYTSHNVYPADLVIDTTSVTTDNFKDFADTIGIDLTDNASGEYGLIKKIFKKNSQLGNKRVTDLVEDVETGSTYDTTNLDKFDNGTGGSHGFKLKNGTYNKPDHKFGCGFLGKSLGDTALNGGYEHLVVISLNQSPINMQESNPYTTWISNSSVTCSQAHCVTLSKVGTDEFNYMTAAKGDPESAAYNNNSNPFNNISIKFGSTTYTGKYGELYDPLCNTYVDQMFGCSIAGGGAGSTTYASAMNFTNYSRDFAD